MLPCHAPLPRMTGHVDDVEIMVHQGLDTVLYTDVGLKKDFVPRVTLGTILNQQNLQLL